MEFKRNIFGISCIIQWNVTWKRNNGRCHFDFHRLLEVAQTTTIFGVKDLLFGPGFVKRSHRLKMTFYLFKAHFLQEYWIFQYRKRDTCAIKYTLFFWGVYHVRRWGVNPVHPRRSWVLEKIGYRRIARQGRLPGRLRYLKILEVHNIH